MKNFCNFIKDEAFTFKYAKGKSDMIGREFHPYHEILLFLGGNAEFISDKIHTKLSPDRLIIIPKESYHQFKIHGNPDDYIRCVFNFYDTSEFKTLTNQSMKDVFITDVSSNIRFLFNKAISIAESQDSSPPKMLLRSVLSLLLTEIPSFSEKPDSKPENSITCRSIEYINENILKPLTVPEIAKKLSISTSSLEHSFKKDMNIPIYRYILEKKLIMVRKKIQSGEPVTKAALECGFKDYSGFYRQYKKMFGTSPSEKGRFFRL